MQSRFVMCTVGSIVYTATTQCYNTGDIRNNFNSHINVVNSVIVIIVHDDQNFIGASEL